MPDMIHSNGGEVARVIGDWRIDGEAIEILDVQTPGTQYQPRAWYVDNKQSRRCAAARAFARRVVEADDVLEIWLIDSKSDLDMVVVVREIDLDRELWLRGEFIEVACEQLSPGEGELAVYAAESVPGWVREGQRLTF